MLSSANRRWENLGVTQKHIGVSPKDDTFQQCQGWGILLKVIRILLILTTCLLQFAIWDEFHSTTQQLAEYEKMDVEIQQFQSSN